MLRVVVVIVIALFSEGESNEKVCKTKECKERAQRILNYMDTAVKPCDNFYKFACGKFLDTAEIRADKPKNDSFLQVRDKLDEQLKSLLSEKPWPWHNEPYNNVKHLFSLCMAEDKMDARGIGHALILLQRAGGWPVLGGWREEGWNFLDTEILLINLVDEGGSLFSIAPYTDMKNNTRRFIQIGEPVFSLSQEYLIKGMDDSNVQAYYSYMVDIAVMFGANRRTAKYQLKESLLFEIELAKIFDTQQKGMNLERMYNLYELPQLMAEIRFIDWAWLLSSMMPDSIFLRKNELINVLYVDYLKELEKLLSSYRPRVIANYMIWHTVQKLLAKTLTNDMRNRMFEFEKVIKGTKARAPRWKECLDEVKSMLPLALSSMYVKKYFDVTLNKDAHDMSEKIRQEIIRNIKELDWMDEETRNKAVFKVSNMNFHIGFPEELLDIRKLEHFFKGIIMNKEHYFEALRDVILWNKNNNFCSLRKPVNKTDWRSHGDITTVNAYHDRPENLIQFPAALLQQPFFNVHLPKYINYASIGVFIGHEITHGFDHQGSYFDYNGNVKEWWEHKSKEIFNNKTKCIIDQYGHFKDNQTEMNLDGDLTLGENIADNGAVKLAYRAYQRQAEKLNKPEPLLPGLQFNQNQLFFLNMANLWCTRYRPEHLKTIIQTDVHPPTEFRVNGPLKNFPQFSEVFQCTSDDPMNPKNKCAVW